VRVTYIQNFEFKCLVNLVFFGKHIESKDHNYNHIWKKITENTGKKRKKGALKSSLSIVTYPQGITVIIVCKKRKFYY